MKKKKEKQSDATKFLERNKIWFTAVMHMTGKWCACSAPSVYL